MNVLDLDINTAIEKYLVRSFERAGFETKIIKINDEAAVNMLLQPEIHEVPPCY